MAEPIERYADLLERATADDNVVGLLLVGSRAADAYVTERSDVDVYIVCSRSDPRWRTPHGDPVEVWPMDLDEFRRHALPGSPDEWNRPAFLEARVVLDKLNGDIAALAERKRRLDRTEQELLASSSLDAYINSTYRSLKSLEAGRALEGQLDALESVSPLLTSAFAMEGRVRPFNKWLRHEIEVRPLRWPGLPEAVERLADGADVTGIRSVFRSVEERAREAGIGAVIDGWEPDVGWLRGE